MPVARSTDPDTSWEAAASIDNQVSLTQLKSVILSTLATCLPLSDEQLHEEIERAFGRRFSPSTVRTRRRELQDLGYVVVVAKKGVTKSGRACQRFTHRDLASDKEALPLVLREPGHGIRAKQQWVIRRLELLVTDLQALYSDLELATEEGLPEWVMNEVGVLLSDAEDTLGGGLSR